MTNFSIQTFSGIQFDVFDPKSELISINDIAHALSNKCRYGGHSNVFYSVAEHSTKGVKYIRENPEQFENPGIQLEFAFLMHDSTEAYLPDIPTPIKANMPEFKALENSLLSVIGKKFHIDFETLHKDIKLCDKIMLDTEWSYLMVKNKKGRRSTSQSQAQAKQRFLSEFNYLYTKLIQYGLF